MRETDLRRADLNLLVILNALLEERSVTRTASRLGMSQPAVSRSLARLRLLFADALLVDGPGGYVLSARAEELRPGLRTLLASVGDLLDRNAFDPRHATGVVRLVMTDLEAAVLAPPLIAALAEQAPDVALEIILPGSRPMDALEHDTADAVVGVIDAAPAGIRKRAVYRDDFVTMMRADHPAAGQAVDLERFLELGHVVVSITGAGRAWVDLALDRMGRERKVTASVPSFLAAVEIVAKTDLVMTLPASLARIADRFHLARQPPPLDLEPVVMSLVWHARHQEAPRHVWLRELIVSAVGQRGL
ncbi:MAG: LysR family transcriptional regulator [Hyphomonas sp.]|jgi:DNA-binding transcriptional LysR family regulator|nr:LysR family transcriptional regulator [Hyphomonas sp.]